jgi:hypothetical protein
MLTFVLAVLMELSNEAEAVAEGPELLHGVGVVQPQSRLPQLTAMLLPAAVEVLDLEGVLPRGSPG